MVVEHVLAEKDPCLTILTDEQSTGLTFIILCSFFSLLAVLLTLALYFDRVVRTSRPSAGAWVFLKTDIDAYFLSLLFADMLVALGGILNLTWVTKGRTTCGSFCSTQGGLEHIGLPAVALSTLAIALHTFFVIFFRWTPPPTRVIGLSVLIGMWAFLILLVLIPALSLSSDVPFYTPTPAWCYIGAAHIALRAGTSYAFSWFAALCSCVIYGLLFLRLRGALIGRSLNRAFLTIITWCRCAWYGGSNSNGSGRVRERDAGMRRWTEDGDSEGARSTNLREARKMLWYPLCYIIIILPLSATRWTSFTDHASDSSENDEVPFGLTAAAASLFKLGGLVDVLLFAFTRPNVLLFSTAQDDERRGDVWHWLRDTSGRRRRGNGGGGDGSDGGAGGADELYEMEVLSIERSEMEGGPKPAEVTEGTGYGGSLVHLLPPVRNSSDIAAGGDEPVRGTLPDAVPQPRYEQDRLVLDLAEEIPYYASPVSPSTSILSSLSRSGPSPGRSGRRRGIGSGRMQSFAPLTLDLPNPRISGISGFVSLGSSAWVPMQREERLAVSEPSSSTGVSTPDLRSHPNETASSFFGFPRRAIDDQTETHSEGDTNQPRHTVASSTTEPAFQFSHDEAESEDLQGSIRRPSTNDVVPGAGSKRGSVPDVIPVTSKDSEQSFESLSPDEDPFRASSLLQSASSTMFSRERRLRGPRPAPARKSFISPITSGPRSRPMRPTIGIPSSSSLTPSPTSRSSTRSPRIRYPQSALAAIPEHRLLDDFPPTGSRFPHSVTPTSPLSLRGSRPHSRPRSLSDGAVRENYRRRKDAVGNTESKGRASYSSFIDMT